MRQDRGKDYGRRVFAAYRQVVEVFESCTFAGWRALTLDCGHSDFTQRLNRSGDACLCHRCTTEGDTNGFIERGANAQEEVPPGGASGVHCR